MSRPITLADLKLLCPNGKTDVLMQLAAVIPQILPAYSITTTLRFCHFIAQAAHETMGFQTLEELGGTAYFEKHYGPQTSVGKRLGNTKKGDGARFHGRGIFQLTGRTNYGIYGKRIGQDLIGFPELAAEPAFSIRIACEYWKAHNLNALADADDITGITWRINGGTKGLAGRKRYLAEAKKLWAGGVSMAKPHPLIVQPDAPEIVSDAPIAMEPQETAAKSPTVLSVVGAVSGSGALGVLSYIESPYALAAFALVLVFAGVIVWRWMGQRK